MNRLRELRIAQGLSLRKLGEKVNMNASVLGNYEREDRQPKTEVWQILADYFKVSVPYIMGLSDSKNEDDVIASKRVSDYLMNSKELEDISKILQSVIKSGNIKTTETVLTILSTITVLLAQLTEHDEIEKLEKLESILFKINEIMNGYIFHDQKKYNNQMIDYNNKHGLDSFQDKKVKEVREIESKFPKPSLSLKDTQIVLKDFQETLSDISVELADCFSHSFKDVYK